MKRTLAILVAAVLFLGMFAIAASASLTGQSLVALNDNDWYEMTITNVVTGDEYDRVALSQQVLVGETYEATLKITPTGTANGVVVLPTKLVYYWYVSNTGNFSDFQIQPVLIPAHEGAQYTIAAADYGKRLTVIAVDGDTVVGKYTDVNLVAGSMDKFIAGTQFGANGAPQIGVAARLALDTEFFNALQELVMAKLVKDETYGTLIPFTGKTFRDLVENAEDIDLQAKLDAAWAAYYALANTNFAIGSNGYNQLIINFTRAIKALKDATVDVIDLQMARTQGKLEALLNSLKALQALNRLNEESTYKLTLAIAQTTDAIAWTKATIRSYNQYTKTWGSQSTTTSIATWTIAPPPTGVPVAANLVTVQTKLNDARKAQQWLMDLWAYYEDFYPGEFARDVLEVADAAALKAAEDAAAASEADKVAAEAAAKAAQEAADLLRETVRELQARVPKLVAVDNIYNFFYGLIGANFFTNALSWVTRNLLFGWLWSPIQYSVSY